MKQLHLVHADVLAQRGRVRVALVAAFVLAEVGLVGRVNVHMLLAVGAVGEASIAAVELAFERLFAWKQKETKGEPLVAVVVDTNTIWRGDGSLIW